MAAPAVSGAQRLRDHTLAALVNLALMGGVVFQLRAPEATATRIEQAPTPSPTSSPTPSLLHVYVSGAVARPDVVVLPEGARAGDAVRAAGGFDGAAARERVNLAAPLVDGQQLHVLRVDEAPPAGVPVSAGVAALPIDDQIPAADGGAVGGPARGGGGAHEEGGIDVNAAPAGGGVGIPWVGPALAARIVAHREANGPFSTVEDLVAVPGIGPKTLERMRSRLIVR